MKKLAIILSFVLVAGIALANLFPANTLADITKSVTEAIRKGSSTELSAFFNSSIDLTVLGKEGTFSKAQAEQIVKEFFQKNTPKSFNIKHQGNSSDGSNYVIGTLTTNNGNFRVYFLIKNIEGKLCIQQLQFEKDQNQ
jgi:hypothetical protein